MFKITSQFKGYINKAEKTNVEPGFLIEGSKNVVMTDDGMVSARKGITLLGAANTALTPIEASVEWQTNSGDERALRAYDDELEVYYNSVWEKVKDSWTAVDFQFAPGYWDDNQKQDAVLFVNGDDNIYYWSGAITTYASCTTNTITKQGTSTWSEERFMTGSYSLRIKDSSGTWREFAYTGGDGTTTLTGVTPDPTAFTFTAGALAMQSVLEISNKPSSDATLFSNDGIALLNNQIYIGSLINNTVYVSKAGDYNTWTPSTPRLVGEACSFTLDGTWKGFAPQEESMYISAGKDYWYQVLFELGSTITQEAVAVKRLKTGTDQGAFSQGGIESFKDKIAFITNEPTLDFLGRIESVELPQSKVISDPIKDDFDFYDFTGCHIKYYKNNLYISIPVHETVRVYNIAGGFWEAPWTLPAGRLAIIDGDLCIHSSSVPETYKMFDGYNDLDNPIECIARFSYQNFGTRTEQKNFNEWYSEGYISSNTTLTRKLYYDYRGVGATRVQNILGTGDFVLNLPGSGGIGKRNLGKEKFAGTSDNDINKKFRVIKEESPFDFYEVATEYYSNDVDQSWSVMAFGCNAQKSSNDNNHIKL